MGTQYKLTRSTTTKTFKMPSKTIIFILVIQSFLLLTNAYVALQPKDQFNYFNGGDMNQRSNGAEVARFAGYANAARAIPFAQRSGQHGNHFADQIKDSALRFLFRPKY